MTDFGGREGLLALLVGIMLIVVIVIAALAFAPLMPFEADDQRTVAADGNPGNLVLSVDADICTVEVEFAEMIGDVLAVDLDVDGRRGLFVSDPAVDLSVEQSTVGDDMLVNVVLDMPSGPTVQYDDLRMRLIIDPGMMVSVTVVTDVGDVYLEAPPGVDLGDVSLFAKVGSVHADLGEGVLVTGDVELRCNVGSVYMEATNAVLEDGVTVTLRTSTGSVHADLAQEASPGGNATILCRTVTGSVYLDLRIAGSTAAEITSQTDVGDINTELEGFEGLDVHLVSQNHPDQFNLEFQIEVDVGSIEISAERTV